LLMLRCKGFLLSGLLPARAADAHLMARPQCRPSAARQGTRAPTRPTDRPLSQEGHHHDIAPQEIGKHPAPPASSTSPTRMRNRYTTLHYTTLHCSRPRLGIRVRVLLFFSRDRLEREVFFNRQARHGQGQGRHDDEGRRQGFSAIKATTMCARRWRRRRRRRRRRRLGGSGDNEARASRGCAISR
jgi:hypothetical protein